MEISAEQFAEWKASPVTVEIFKGLEKIVEELKEQLANGNTIGETPDKTHGYTNQVAGRISGIRQILDISYSDSEDDTDGKSRY